MTVDQTAVPAVFEPASGAAPVPGPGAPSAAENGEHRPLSAGDGELAEDRELVVEELLIEDVSIDGMCGVY